MNQVLFQRAARILPWSSWTARSLIEDYGIAPERIEVLPPGIDLECWQPAVPSNSELPVRILFVGGDFYRKGGQVLLDAFHRLPPGQAELDLVTRTVLPPEPGVRLYHDLQPNTPELINLYQTAGIFVLPSLAEAFGIAAVEAAAAGLPVIASHVGGLTDIVVDDRNGFLVPPSDAASLAARLEMLICNPQMRRQMGQNGRFRAEQYFDARKNASRINDLLIEIATAWKPS